MARDGAPGLPWASASRHVVAHLRLRIDSRVLPSAGSPKNCALSQEASHQGLWIGLAAHHHTVECAQLLRHLRLVVMPPLTAIFRCGKSRLRRCTGTTRSAGAAPQQFSWATGP